ncbi:MAG TPA: hypothetical protein VFP69_20000 [Streptomyces sp.]|nr:hypothetical protein [Streptomyces sp.]
MQSPDVAPHPDPSPADHVVDVEQAEAALVEHYPRLVRLAYLVLPPRLGRNRRVLTAHALTQRALPRGRTPAPLVPAQPAGRNDPGYALVRLRVLRTALEADLPYRHRVLPRRSHLPPLLPQTWGLKVFPRSGGADELALDRQLAALSAPARAAYVLRGLEKLPEGHVREVLAEAGVADVAEALRAADEMPERYALLQSPEFDACSLQARPTDLMRRRQHMKAALAAGAALLVCGVLLGMPGDAWSPDGAAAPPYARNPAAEAALDPGKLTKVAPAAWQTSARTDFSVWPARGALVRDKALLRRALAVWARPGGTVRVTATPGTPSGGPSGPPRLLYAGEVGRARVVVLYDGLRIARYAEPADGTQGAALDFARVDGAGAADANAVVLERADGNVRYLMAPWVKGAAVRDLAKPDAPERKLTITGGVTAPLASPAARPAGPCRSWQVLRVTDGTATHVLSDLGELVPARLTAGRPGSVTDTAGAEELRAWAPYACSLDAVRSTGVRSVNTWVFAEQRLPDEGGRAAWVCTRAETWRGGGERVLAQFRAPDGPAGTVAARAENVTACGVKDPHVLAGVLWKSPAGHWYLLAAGSEDTKSVRTTGAVEGSARGRLLVVRAKQGARAGLKGTLRDGRTIRGLG